MEKDTKKKDNKSIYYVSAISLHKLTEKDLRLKYEIYKLKFNREFPYEKYLANLKTFKEDKYNISDFISSYHDTKEEAIEYVVENIGDINEAGSYEYASVSKAELGRCYFNSCNSITDYILYKYNHDIDKYEELDKNSEEYSDLSHYVWGYI